MQRIRFNQTYIYPTNTLAKTLINIIIIVIYLKKIDKTPLNYKIIIYGILNRSPKYLKVRLSLKKYETLPIIFSVCIIVIHFLIAPKTFRVLWMASSILLWLNPNEALKYPSPCDPKLFPGITRVLAFSRRSSDACWELKPVFFMSKKV